MFIDKFYTKFCLLQFGKRDKNSYIEFPVFFKGKEYIKFGKNLGIGRMTRIEAWSEYQGRKYRPKIIFGENVVMNSNCHIGAINQISIGNNVLIGANVLIIDHTHGRVNSAEKKISPNNRVLFSKGKVIIEDNVWIGENVIILPNVRIGHNVIIGAGSVVTKSFKDNVVIAGNPAKIIKEL